MFIPTLADKAALKLFYINSNVIDFSPYNTFANIIQRFYKLYILRVRACIYIQKIYRGYSWREVIFDFRGTNGQYVSRIVQKLRPEWPIEIFTSQINMGLTILDTQLKVHSISWRESWREWARFYDNWITAFYFYRNPNLTRMRMNYHASMYHTRIAFRFHD